MLLQILERGVPFVPESIDWGPVLSRIRTAALKASFTVELADAQSNGLLEAFDRILGRLGNTLPATPDNLKEYPHKFLRQMHVIQLARDAGLANIQEAPTADELGTGDALEDEVEDIEAALDYDPRNYRKVFSLLPIRSGQSVFIFLDKKRAAIMGLDVTGNQWYDNIFDLSGTLTASKLRTVIPESFRTDGVQLKVALKRPGTTSDLMVKRGFGSLKGRSCAAIGTEKRGIFELHETRANSLAVVLPLPMGAVPGAAQLTMHVDLIGARGVIGLDPGRKDVYSSVSNWTESQKNARHLSNEQWSQEQRSRLIRRKDYKWRRVTGISRIRPIAGGPTVLGGLCVYSPRTGRYDSLIRSVRYRLGSAEILSSYQTRRNRQVYRFSRLLATKSATARVCNAIIHHGKVLPRDPERKKSRYRGRKTALAPIVVFGGGQYASGGSGLASVPRKALIRELGHKTVVVIADEFNTSQKCCKCGTKLIYPDLRPYGDSGRVGLKRKFADPDSRRLRQCPSEACRLHDESPDGGKNKIYSRHWNRDTNAAINILHVGLHWWRHGTRPDSLRKSTVTELVNSDSPFRNEALEDISMLSEQ